MKWLKKVGLYWHFVDFSMGILYLLFFYLVLIFLITAYMAHAQSHTKKNLECILDIICNKQLLKFILGNL